MPLLHLGDDKLFDTGSNAFYMRRVSLIIVLFLLTSLLPFGIIQNSTANLGQNSISVSSGSYQAISLGFIGFDW